MNLQTMKYILILSVIVIYGCDNKHLKEKGYSQPSKAGVFTVGKAYPASNQNNDSGSNVIIYKKSCK